MKSKKFLPLILIASLMVPTFALAKGGRSGGFSRSSSSRSSYSRPSSSSSSTRSSSGWGSKPKATSSSGSTRSSTSTKTSTTQSKLSNSVKSKPTFQNRSSAVSSFKSKMKSDPKTAAAVSKKYPTTYASQPATRPSHIPTTYNNHTTVYQNGSYGYVGSNGVFTALTTMMLMDTMSDAMMMGAMSSAGHHYSVAPVHRPTVIHSSGTGFGWIMVLVTGLFIVFICVMLTRVD